MHSLFGKRKDKDDRSTTSIHDKDDSGSTGFIAKISSHGSLKRNTSVSPSRTPLTSSLIFEPPFSHTIDPSMDYYSKLPLLSQTSTRRDTSDTSETPPSRFRPPWFNSGSLPRSPKSTEDFSNIILQRNDPLNDFSFEMKKFDSKPLTETSSCIRVYRRQGTFVTISCPLAITAGELIEPLIRKFFVNEADGFRLFFEYKSMERILESHEQPWQIQLKLLIQAGYTKSERLNDQGREDHSYLCRFVFESNPLPPDIGPHYYSQLVNTQYVDLRGRHLSTIPTALFSTDTAAKLLTLDLSQNLMLLIPIEFYQLCLSLRELKLSNNELINIPENILYLQSLNQLDLSCNKLVNIDPRQFQCMMSLTSLSFNANLLSELPTDFTAWDNVSTLNIANNKLVEFPTILCKYRSLENLDISFNQFITLPNELGCLTHLQRFIIAGNQLTGALPSSFMHMIKLIELDIRGNRLSDITAISHLPQLRTLLSGNCQLSGIRVLSLPSLSRLSINRNPLVEFSLHGAHSSLTLLNLSRCQLATLADDLFSGMTSLERLKIDHNQLTTLPSSLSNIPRLREVHAAYNLLQVLPAGLMTIQSLEILDLHNNNIKQLPNSIWNFTNLSVLNVSSNLLEDFPLPLSHIRMTTNEDRLQHQSDNAPVEKLSVPIKSAIPTLYTEVTLDSNKKQTRGSSAIKMPLNIKTDNVKGAQSELLSPMAMIKRRASVSVPPLASVLHHLYLTDNLLTDEVFIGLSIFQELRTLNLSYNQISDIYPEALKPHAKLVFLYLSGNHITSLPDGLGSLKSLRGIFVNGNKLTTVPAEVGKLGKLAYMDLSRNNLKYNIANWPYDWNWNWNHELKYLNLSNNQRLEIRPALTGSTSTKGPTSVIQRDLTDFSSLSKLKVLGLMDVTLSVPVPDEDAHRRIRTISSELSNVSYGMADSLCVSECFCCRDLVVNRPRNTTREDEFMFGLFDGHNESGAKLSKYLYDNFYTTFMTEFSKVHNVLPAIRRTFLISNQNFATTSTLEYAKAGCSSLVAYIWGTVLYIAQAGDSLAVLSHHGTARLLTTQHNTWDTDERRRIRDADGYISHQMLVGGETQTTRQFGYYLLAPAINADPFVIEIKLVKQDEFLILASKPLWDFMSFQMAVDIVRQDQSDLSAAAQKLRDYAVAYGARGNLVVMVIGFEQLIRSTMRRVTSTNSQHVNALPGKLITPRKFRPREDVPNDIHDSTLRRLGQEVSPPVGQVALVFTDIKSSTYLWETRPTAMRLAIKMHNTLFRRLLRNIGGYEVKTEGDAFMMSFHTVFAAIEFCLQIQLQLLTLDWPLEMLDAQDARQVYDADNNLIYTGIRVRMGIHWGTPVCEADPITGRMDYFGPMVNRSARICSSADGGEIALSSNVQAELMAAGLIGGEPVTIDENDPKGAERLTAAKALERFDMKLFNLGEIQLKGLENAESMCLLYPQSLAARYEMTRAAPALSVVELKSPVSSLMPLDIVRQFNRVLLRIERLSAGRISSESDLQHDSLLIYTLTADMSDEIMLLIIESVVTRMENAITSLFLKQEGVHTQILNKLKSATEATPSLHT